MPSLNKVIIIGNVGNEPEMRFTPNGKPVTSFSVATNWVYTTPEGERRQETEWFNVVAWNRLAEQCNQFLAKGKLVYTEGRIHTRNWEGQDGQAHSKMEVVANRVIFLDRKAAVGAIDEKTDDPSTAEMEPEDLPF
ncbi:MAG: single-stranded DNA-binding protein [Dehalococcoidales bacterium]|nr:single-stranded DNA-binding protein [Dehalococcoidales bacterium]